MNLKDKINKLKSAINDLDQYLPALEVPEEKANMQLLINAQFAFIRMKEYEGLYSDSDCDKYEDEFDKSVDELEIHLGRARKVSFSNQANSEFLRYMVKYWDEYLDDRR